MVCLISLGRTHVHVLNTVTYELLTWMWFRSVCPLSAPSSQSSTPVVAADASLAPSPHSALSTQSIVSYHLDPSTVWPFSSLPWSLTCCVSLLLLCALFTSGTMKWKEKRTQLLDICSGGHIQPWAPFCLVGCLCPPPFCWHLLYKKSVLLIFVLYYPQQLSQFWYDAETALHLANEAARAVGSGGRWVL